MRFLNVSSKGIATWYHLIQTVQPSGQSKVLATICSHRSVEHIKTILQNYTSKNIIYSIDPTQVYEINRRCDICNCSK